MNGSLFLCPELPDARYPEITAIVKLLKNKGLIDQQQDNDSYLCGENFTQLITFMGCSPYLVFEPPADGTDKYCHIYIRQYPNIQLFTGQQTAPPRCPECRFRIADWKNRLKDWTARPTSSWHCPECGNTSHAYQLDWRQSGGAGQLFIEIKNIFPGEAVPVDSLLKDLQDLSGLKWRYFYLV